MNTYGGYFCRCKSGFQGNGVECSNFDECSEGSHTCGESAYCMDRNGSFVCECDDGFLLDIATNECHDWNECSDSLVGHHCPLHSKCVNTLGSYDCRCDMGFKANNGTCENVNECESYADACDTGHTCVDTVGGFTCLCHDGFEETPIHGTCDDIDECATTQHQCYDWAHRFL